MASFPLSTAPDHNGKGLQFRMTISLGNVIHTAVLLTMATVGWTTIQDRQLVADKTQAEQQREISRLVDREEIAAQLNAQQAAIIDGLEKRIMRVEQLEDGRK